jgi:MinD-like ATPase involved in chromosome partitioning or flagellar assembly
MNMVGGPREAAAVAGHFTRVARDVLGVNVSYAGYIVRDSAVEDAVRSREPLLLRHPNSPAAACVEQVLRGLKIGNTSERINGDGFFRKFFSLFSRQVR